MADELLKHLYDIREATAAIFRFIRGKTFDGYEQDELFRSGIERKFEIIGEKLTESAGTPPLSSTRYGGIATIVSFRNILAHGYDSIDHRIVWGIVEEDLGTLLEDVERLVETETRPELGKYTQLTATSKTRGSMGQMCYDGMQSP